VRLNTQTDANGRNEKSGCVPPVNVHVAGAIDGSRGETGLGRTFTAIALIRRCDGDMPVPRHEPRMRVPWRTLGRAEVTSAGLMTRVCRSSTNCAIHSGAGNVRGCAVANP
jgi:hypothetical protein